MESYKDTKGTEEDKSLRMKIPRKSLPFNFNDAS